MITLASLLCLMAVVLALVEAFRGYLRLDVRLNFGWLAFALWATSLLVR